MTVAHVVTGPHVSTVGIPSPVSVRRAMMAQSATITWTTAILILGKYAKIISSFFLIFVNVLRIASTGTRGLTR